MPIAQRLRFHAVFCGILLRFFPTQIWFVVVYILSCATLQSANAHSVITCKNLQEIGENDHKAVLHFHGYIYTGCIGADFQCISRQRRERTSTRDLTKVLRWIGTLSIWIGTLPTWIRTLPIWTRMIRIYAWLLPVWVWY